MRLDAPQRDRDRRDVFDALRWLRAGVFESIAHDLRILLRLVAGRGAEPCAAIFDSRTLQSERVW